LETQMISSTSLLLQRRKDKIYVREAGDV
jgi:hypothetical protein